MEELFEKLNKKKELDKDLNKINSDIEKCLNDMYIDIIKTYGTDTGDFYELNLDDWIIDSHTHDYNSFGSVGGIGMRTETLNVVLKNLYVPKRDIFLGQKNEATALVMLSSGYNLLHSATNETILCDTYLKIYNATIKGGYTEVSRKIYFNRSYSLDVRINLIKRLKSYFES